jgi:magnesium-transporting ATPase (P-type)
MVQFYNVQIIEKRNLISYIIDPYDSGRTIYNIGTSLTYWITILLIIILGLLPRFLGKVIYQMLWPSDIQIAREAEILRKILLKQREMKP